MISIEDALNKWYLAHGFKRGLFGGLSALKHWKWPTKRELRDVTGMDPDAFEEALSEAVSEGSAEVQNGRVRWTCVPGGSC